MRKIIILISFIMLVLLMPKFALAAEPLIQATFSPNPITIAPGNDGYIQLTLKNSGTLAANRIKISRVSFDSNIILSGNWISDLSPLGPGDSTTSLFKFHVSEMAPSGLYTLTFYIDYGDGSITRTISSNVIINVQAPSTLEITSVEPSSLRPGEKTNITFTITNKGSSSITNIIFTWTSSNNVILPLGSSNRVVIPIIGANSQYKIPVEISVSPSAVPGVYSLSTSIQYFDKSGTNQTVSSIVGIEIGGGTDFDVSLQELSGNTISLYVANIGVNPAASVIIKIPEQERFSTIGATSVFLGDLSPGDYTIASFQLISRNVTGRLQGTNATRGNVLKVEISYTDTTGSRQIVQKEVLVRELSMQPPTYARQRNTGFGIWMYAGIGMIGIIAVVLFFKFFKGKKK